jgi:hypothetical protein
MSISLRLRMQRLSQMLAATGIAVSYELFQVISRFSSRKSIHSPSSDEMQAREILK